jgi:hypothetical protein
MRRMTDLRLSAGAILPALRVSSLALLILASYSAHELSAQRAPNIDPSISRPPLLLTGTPAEANRQVRELALMTLMQALQSGDAERIDIAVSDIPTEETAPSSRCKKLRDGVDAVRGVHALGLEETGGVLPIFAEGVTQRDSAEMTVAELQLVVAPKGKAQVRTPARLTYDNREAKWRSSKGILTGLCAAAGRTK